MLMKWLDQLLGWLDRLRGPSQKVEGDKIPVRIRLDDGTEYAQRGELLYLGTDGALLVVTRVGVTGAMPEIRGASVIDTTTTLERYPLLRGSLE